MKNDNLKIKLKILIVIFIFTFFFLNISTIDAALLYLDPSQGEYGKGDTFIVKVRIDNEGECINAVDTRIWFPPNILKAVDFSRGDSIFSLWVKEPEIDNSKGVVYFSGGIPGGYCGRIQGDPAMSNVLGKIIFSVPFKFLINQDKQEANVEISLQSRVFLNDGNGTIAETTVKNAQFMVFPTPISSANEWLEEVKKDDIPPESFNIRVEMTDGVFDGKYYIVFSTVDKQSGLDYFEIFERGLWRRIQSPYKLKDQSLQDQIKVRAIDKAGNERDGEYIAPNIILSSSSKSQTLYLIFIVIIVFIGIGIYFDYKRPKKRKEINHFDQPGKKSN